MAEKKQRIKSDADFAEGDMTPMIDMTFQLIAFFMVLVNFADAQQLEGITLPRSTLAKPPDVPLETPVTLQIAQDGSIYYGGMQLTVENLAPALLRKKQVIEVTPGESMAEATVILRADFRTETGVVQEVIKVCQETGFEKFALRAKQAAVGEQKPPEL
jgi:biopolymer transport protein ExbD